MKSILLAAILAILANGASAHEYKLGSLEIKHPWSRATPKGATVAAGYLAIVNKGTSADRLVSVSSAAAGASEIHEMSMNNGVMKMRPLPNGVEIKPGATAELKPSSDHVMFVGVKQPFEKGARIKATLTFEKAGPVDVEFLVEAAGATPGQHTGQGGMDMQHGH